MPWFYVDDGFSDSKPIMNLPTTPVRVPMRVAAAGAWVLAGAWSAKEETDGHVPHPKLKSLLIPKSVVAALCDPGPMDAALCAPECPPSAGIVVKNWAKWQQTKAENDSKRKAAAEKKRDQRRRGRNFVASMDGQMSPRDNNSDEDPDSKKAYPRDIALPTPPHPLVVTLGGESPVGTGDGPPPPTCPDHPNGTASKCGPCGDARKANTRWLFLAAQDRLNERTRILDQIHACDACDDNGLTHDDDPPQRCPLHLSKRDLPEEPKAGHG